MEELPRLGVVVLNWNGRSHLESCLPGLVRACGSRHFALVVDNDSRDGSADWIREHHPELELLVLSENRRFAGGNNAGVQRALERGADVVVCLNNDTRVEEGLLDALAEVFLRDDSIAVVGPRIVYADAPEKIWFGGGEGNPATGWVSHRALRSSTAKGSDPEGDTAWITGCCLAVRAEVWEALGGLDETFYIYSEDVDFCLRARKMGGRVFYTPRGRLRHAVSSSVGGQDSPFKAYHRTRSRWQLLGRHGEGVLWPAGVLVQDLFLLSRCLLRGRFGAAMAVAEAWWDLMSPGNPLRHPAGELLSGAGTCATKAPPP